jgi:hypothetical protein
MSILFGDGFDHYGTGDIALKWDANGGIGISALAIESTSGRNGKGCLFTRQCFVQKNVTAGNAFIVGFALKLDNSGQSGSAYVVLVRDSTTNNDLVAIKWDTDNKLKIVNPNTGTVLASPSAAVTTGVWNYVEFKISIGSSIAANSCQLRINQATVATVPATTSTLWGTATSANAIQVGSVSGALNAFTAHIDDCVIIDTSTGTPTDYIGDITIEAIYPSASGNYTDFSPTGSSVHYLAVNEHPPDSDTTYLASNNNGARESFTFTGTTDAIASVKAIQHVITARKQGSGGRNVASFVRKSGVNYDNSDIALGTGYTMTRQIENVNPATSAAYTASEIATLEAGFKGSN